MEEEKKTKKGLKIELNKKTAVIGGIAAIVLVAIIVLIVVLVGNGGQKGKLEDNLKTLGTDFYENFYYNQIGSDDAARAEFVAKFESTGIKINLDNLSRYNSETNAEIIASFVNNKTNEECNKEDSKVIIYPKDPYGVKDYTIEVKLVCGFDGEEEAE